MSKTHYPGADATAQYFAQKFTGLKMAPNVVVLHTTETTAWPGYGGGASAPHMTILPDPTNQTVRIRQHYPADRSARALVNKLGGVETNTLNAFQIELAGTCDSRYRERWGKLRAGVDYIYWPHAPEWALQAVADVLRWLHAEWPGFPLQDAAQRGWAPYPDSYGEKAAQRLTGREWQNAYGVLGHQHVPENAHGDPGDLDVDQILKLAKAPEVHQDVPWHRLATYNIKAPSLTRTGAHAWKSRRSYVVEVIEEARADVACLQETGSGDDLDWLTGQLAGVGLKRAPGGGNWRHVFYGPRVTYHESGSFTTDPALDGDLKHATWMWGEIDGIHGLWCSMHFESEDGARADKVRPEQATDVIVELKNVAATIKAKHGVVIPRENWFPAGDTNSETWVTKRFKDKHQFLASTAVAKKWFNRQYASFTNWVKNRLGQSVDEIYVGKGRPVLARNQIRNSIASDHNLQIAVIGKTPKEIAS